MGAVQDMSGFLSHVLAVCPLRMSREIRRRKERALVLLMDQASPIGRYSRRISKPSADTSGSRGCCPHQIYSLVRNTDIKRVVVTKGMATSKQSASHRENVQHGSLNVDLVRQLLCWGSDH